MPRVDMTHESMRHYYRGRVFESTGEIDIAVDEYKKAIELGADYADVRNSLGRAFAKKGLIEEAKSEFNSALRMNPHYLEAQRNLDELDLRVAQLKKESVSQRHSPVSQAARHEIHRLQPEQKKSLLKPALAAAMVCLVVIAGVIAGSRLLPKDEIATFISPSPDITGMVFDGKSLWMCDWLKQEIYQCTIAKDGDFSVKNTHRVSGIYPVSVAVGEGYLWTCDAWNKKVHQQVLDGNLTVIKSYNSPGDNPSGISWDGKDLWSCDLSAAKIYRHSTDEKLTVKAEYASPAEKLIGFFWDGKNYWSVDGAKGVLYKHKNDNNLSLIRSYTLNLANRKIGGIFLDKKSVWIAFEGEKIVVRYPRSKVLK